MQPRYPIDGVSYRGAEELHRYLQVGDWLDTTAGQQLRTASLHAPNKVAVRGHDGDLTFSDLDELSESLAASLIEAGLRPGDRVIFQIGVVKELFTILFACFKAGIIPVCALPQHRDIEIAHFAEQTHARALFVQGDVHPSFDQVGFARRMAAKIPTIDYIGITRGDVSANELALDQMMQRFVLTEAKARTHDLLPSCADVVVLQLSGGSSGLPKVIPRMHGEYLAQSLAVANRYELNETDICLWTLPLIHNAGMLLIVLPSILQRRTTILQPRFDIQLFLHTLERDRVTFTGSIGPVAAKLFEMQDAKCQNFGSLRQFFCMSRADAMEDYIGITCTNQYGISEGLILASAPSDSREARHLSNGWPTGAADEVKLLIPETEDDVSFGEVGEFCFRGASCLTGYLGEDNAERTFTSDGYFRTGDLMRELRIEGRRYFVFEGRTRDNINRGGEKIGAEEVERLMASYPGIADVRVTAMPDPVYGEKVCAFVIARPGCVTPTVPEVADFLLGLGVAKYKLPERIEPLDMFPTTSVGKVDKAQLRQLIAKKIEAELARHNGHVKSNV
jgi:non-ribosomal peptide synthetase component E (peptide arylation enzyme)